MQDEIDALHCNNTLVLVPPPHGENVVGSKWVFHTKFEEDGGFGRCKARLVALLKAHIMRPKDRIGGSKKFSWRPLPQSRAHLTSLNVLTTL